MTLTTAGYQPIGAALSPNENGGTGPPHAVEGARSAGFEPALARSAGFEPRSAGFQPASSGGLEGRAPGAFSDVAKFSPDQPRVPAGGPGGGQWTSGDSGGGASAAGSAGSAKPAASARPRAADHGGGAQHTESSRPQSARSSGAAGQGHDGATLNDGVYRPGADGAATLTPVADRAWPPIDPNVEDAHGGHIIDKHVGRTDDQLLTVEKFDSLRINLGEITVTNSRASEGSFSSLAQATDLINRTLKQNQSVIDQVVEGKKKWGIAEAQFDSVTGKEATRTRADSEPFMRLTHGVRVVIKPDRTRPQGFRVVTAFPIGDDD